MIKYLNYIIHIELMVYKLFSKVYIGKNYEIFYKGFLANNKIDKIVAVSNIPIPYKNVLRVSFNNKDFFTILDQCLKYILDAILQNQNVMICCDNGCTESSIIVLYYLIIYLNMNFDFSVNFLKNHLDINTSNKYFDKLRNKFTKTSILTKN